VKFDWIETIVGVNEEVCLDLYQENHMTIIQMFFIINLHGPFSLSHIRELISYAELQKNQLVVLACL
jgi:hypothetical protein